MFLSVYCHAVSCGENFSSFTTVHAAVVDVRCICLAALAIELLGPLVLLWVSESISLENVLHSYAGFCKCSQLHLVCCFLLHMW